MMRPPLPARACRDLALDQVVQGLVQLEGRLQEPPQARCLGQARELQEDLVHVVADGLIGR